MSDNLSIQRKLTHGLVFHRLVQFVDHRLLLFLQEVVHYDDHVLVLLQGHARAPQLHPLKDVNSDVREGLLEEEEKVLLLIHLIVAGDVGGDPVVDRLLHQVFSLHRRDHGQPKVVQQDLSHKCLAIGLPTRAINKVIC